MSINQDNAKSKAARLLMEESAELEESDESSVDADDDDRSSKFSSTKSVTSTEDRQLQEKRELEELIKNETKSVATWRETVTGILMIIAFIACVATFIFLGREEYIGFKSSFQESAILLATKYSTDAEALSKNARVLSEMVTANSEGTNSTWPFVTVPSFEVYGRHIRSTDGSDLVFMAPLVTDENRAKWEDYSNDNQDWISASMVLSGEAPLGNDGRDPIMPFIHSYGGPVPQGTGPYAPVWEISAPPKNTSVINLDLFKYPPLQDIFSKVNPSAKESVISRVLDLSPLTGDPDYNNKNPRSLLITRVFDTLLEENAPRQVGMVALSVAWETIFENALQEDIQGIQIVVRNSCQQDTPFTYMLRGGNATFVGTGDDVIDTFYEDMEYIFVSPAFATEEDGGCTYSLHIYPTQELRLGAKKEDKIIFTVSVLGLFIVVWIVFWCYDRSVQKRNEKMLTTAAKSNLIVSSLFPSNFKKRLFEEEEGGSNNQKKGWGPMAAPSLSAVKNSKPLADFFPEASVLFADIVGFTAWSSVREPSQVFILLESIYSEFDAIAKRRRIFKIETIGDCYVACAGLPEPRADHASALCRFANEAMNKMHEMVATLEETLGPDTGDLSMRFGVHSGPVTAGVLRGERSRFQLFGDTVNTAARLESSSTRGRIHLSQVTATILTNTGKGNWVVPREDQVHAKGKGFMTTFWLVINKKSSESNSVSTSSLSEKFAIPEKVKRPKIILSNSKTIPPKTLRLVAWNVEILQRLLKLVVARRQASKSRSLFPSQSNLNEAAFDKKLREGKMVIHEVEEVITLPKYDADAAKAQENASTAEINETVIEQLREYIRAIALRYKDNPFHNFEHASHVTMSVTKLLSRIVAPNASSIQTTTTTLDDEQLHDHTYGITSDPLTQFSCIFSALIHDVEHTGVPNATLVKEEHPLSHKYAKVSVAEQNSVDVAWDLLMEPRFKDLRGVIYTNEAEMRHFRKLVVNCVMATDIVDKGLKELRNKRWERAFYWEGDKKASSPPSLSSSSEDGREQDVNRKATIVIEHLLQASDVSHTMQHWHVFRKWNENLFLEMYTAYRQGRADKHPAEFWYKGEIGFFDFYVIPLAKKLSQCGVFGVCSDEYLTYAESNRNEWQERGEDVVRELSKKALDYYENKHGNGSANGIGSNSGIDAGRVAAAAVGSITKNNNGIGTDSGRSSLADDEGSVINAAFLNSVHAPKENQRDPTATLMDTVDEESSFAEDDAGRPFLITNEVDV